MQVRNSQFFDTAWFPIRFDDCILEDFISVFRKIIDYVYVGYKTEKFTLPVMHLTVLVRVTVLVR